MSERIIDWVSISQLKEITGKDRVTISKRLGDLNYKTGNRGAKLYDKMVAIQAIMNKGISGDDTAKERKALADAEKAEIIVAQLRGELVPVVNMKTAAAQLIKTLYARVVRVTPSVVAPQLLGLTDALEIEAKLRDALADAFNELKSMPEHFLTVDPDDNPPTEVEEP